MHTIIFIYFVLYVFSMVWFVNNKPIMDDIGGREMDNTVYIIAAGVISILLVGVYAIIGETLLYLKHKIRTLFILLLARYTLWKFKKAFYKRTGIKLKI